MAIQQTKQTKEEEQITSSTQVKYQLPKKVLPSSAARKPIERSTGISQEILKTIGITVVIIAVLFAAYFVLMKK